MPRGVKIAVMLAFGLHGVLILTAQYRLSYDAYNHMFFGDHYLNAWWSLWEARWYTGFDIISYPPMVHQLIALLGHMIGVDAAYALLLWGVIIAYPLAVYAFSQIFTSRAAASYAALGASILPSIYLSAHTFGQLPSLAGTLLALFGISALADFLRGGNKLSGAVAVSLFTTVAATHHATLLFLPWLCLAVLFRLTFEHGLSRIQLFRRLLLFTILTLPAMLMVIWPFWDWGVRQVIQTPIDHASRHNFFKDPFAAVLFFFPMYGLFIPCVPFAFWIGLRKRYWGLGLTSLFLFLLGLGDTTPLARMFFREGWAWLTYDRFAFWASLSLLPLFGALAGWLFHQKINQYVKVIFIGLSALIGLIIGLIPSWLPTQPKPVVMQPIVDFLTQGDHAQYRYLTFGFGDQLAYLSRLTDATTIDGSYHTARTLPELRNSGIGQIDSAYWLSGGMDALDPILDQASALGVRWGFVNLAAYKPLLQRNGWVQRSRLTNSIEVWENPAAVLPPPVQPSIGSPFAEFSWGTFPLCALFLSVILAIQCYLPASRSIILTSIQAVAIGLLPLGLCLWYYRELFIIELPRIYFTYSDALFFLSDGLALIVIVVGLIKRLPAPDNQIVPEESFQLQNLFRHAHGWLFGLCLLATLSIAWSLEKRTALYFSLHLWLCFGVYLGLQAIPQAWSWFARGCWVALGLQIAIGSGQFLSQSTALTKSLGLEWPGVLNPSMSGVSVVQLPDGARWLRVYGTLPHPNLEGGFALAMLVAPLAYYLIAAKQRIPFLVLLNAALALILLTFSRSTWSGLALFSISLALRLSKAERKKLLLIGLTGLITLVIIGGSLRSLFITRLGNTQVRTERASIYTRIWLIQRTLELIQKNPLLGTGIGSHSLALSEHVGEGYPIEPVHNIPLLVASELGPAGTILLGGLALVIITSGLKTHRTETLIFSAGMAGLLLVSCFDHYFWTLAPGRLMFVTLLGLWAGQVKTDENRD